MPALAELLRGVAPAFGPPRSPSPRRLDFLGDSFPSPVASPTLVPSVASPPASGIGPASSSAHSFLVIPPGPGPPAPDPVPMDLPGLDCIAVPAFPCAPTILDLRQVLAPRPAPARASAPRPFVCSPLAAPPLPLRVSAPVFPCGPPLLSAPAPAFLPRRGSAPPSIRSAPAAKVNAFGDAARSAPFVHSGFFPVSSSDTEASSMASEAGRALAHFRGLFCDFVAELGDSSTGPVEKREALPFSVSFVAWLERRIMDPACPIPECIVIGSVLCLTWASLRWNDGLWSPPSRVVLQAGSLSGLATRTKSCRASMPWGCQLLGLTGTSASCWGISWVSALQQCVAAFRPALWTSCFRSCPRILRTRSLWRLCIVPVPCRGFVPFSRNIGGCIRTCCPGCLLWSRSLLCLRWQLPLHLLRVTPTPTFRSDSDCSAASASDSEPASAAKASRPAQSAPPLEAFLHNPRSNVLHRPVLCSEGDARSVRIQLSGLEVFWVRPACGASVGQLSSDTWCPTPPAGAQHCLRRACQTC